MKLVLDSNIIIAAFSSRGLCNSLFELCLDRYTIVISEFIISEVNQVLAKKFKIPQKNITVIKKFLNEFCNLGTYNKLSKQVCRDPNDDEILALAISNDVDFIITGDKDLLDLKSYNSIKIISARDFWTFAKEEKLERPNGI